MEFDPGNPVIRLCADGMMLEGEGKQEEAAKLFNRAWEQAADDFEKFTAAHYVARHQDSVAGKLQWDETALGHAQKVDDENMKATYPSLYLNIAKGYEDLGDSANALKNYELAKEFSAFLADDGYGNMIRAGIGNGINRVSKFL
ncbi:MAG TPA: hypothetical protein VHC47_07595 [Mucilaginibacter sp.]|nr:hypothetical protein [Mucilaginibacter sp.]